jgi:membrane-associated phospholipid phosphatase
MPLRRTLLFLGLAAAWIGLAVLFAHFGSELVEGELRNIDTAVRGLVLKYQPTPMRAVFAAITWVGAIGFVIPLAVLVAWRVFRQSWPRLLVVAAFAFLASEIVGILKRSFGVTRPLGGVTAGLGYSFPSGHTGGSMAVAVVLTYLSIRTRTASKVVPWVAFGVTVLVGISRVMLDVHWTSDVVGGWLVGAAIGGACCSLLEILPDRSMNTKWADSVSPSARHENGSRR